MPTEQQDSLHSRSVLRDGMVLFLAATSLGACSRDPLDIPCPAANPGDLVVTEIHGPQRGEDNYGEWIEVYNSGGTSIDLSGLSVAFIRLDGSSDSRLFVREPVLLDPGEYVVLGRQPVGAEPAHVDYGYIGDIDSEIYDSAAVEVSSCGERLDLIVYRNLPARGSLILDGDISPPSALANDDALNWCVDDREDDNTEISGIRGTPREENPSCSE